MKQRNLLPLLLLFVSAPAWSAPAISLGWDNCTGPINQANTGSHVYSLFVSVVGIDRPHKAFQVEAVFGTTDNTTPEAWWYDILDYGELVVPPAVSVTPDRQTSQICPALNGGLRGLYITSVRPRYTYEATPLLPYGTMQFQVANAYADNQTFDPNQRYFMARIDFDHSTSVEGEGVPGTSRGGFEQPIWFRLDPAKCSLLGLDSLEYPLDSSNGAVLATFGGSPSATPAIATTWGQIRNQYRH